VSKPVLFLRIASVLTFIHAVLHTMGGVFGAIEPGPAALAAEAMKVNTFIFMGSLRTFWMFYRGLGLGISIFLIAESILMWQLSSLAWTDAHRLRPIMATFLIAYLVFSVNSYAYFFAGPVIAEILIAASLGVAMITAKPQIAA
jgi:hypothetical protein